MSATFRSNLPQVQEAIQESIKEGMVSGIEFMRGRVVKNLKQRGHGRIYRLPGVEGVGEAERQEYAGYVTAGEKPPKKLLGKFYVASAQGEYPAVRLAGLSGPGGVETEVVDDATATTAKIGSRLKYGLFLEKRPESRGGRPWLKRTYDEQKDEIHAAFEKGVDAAMKRRGG